MSLESSGDLSRNVTDCTVSIHPWVGTLLTYSELLTRDRMFSSSSIENLQSVRETNLQFVSVVLFLRYVMIFDGNPDNRTREHSYPSPC